MKRRDIWTTLVRRPSLLWPASRYCLLISHMRANTSLLGHIIGSHPDVSGYYEQHVGYSGARSLFRGRLLFHKRNPTARVTPIYFDKVLHNHHEIGPRVLARSDVCAIFALRAPEEAIRSLVALYSRVDPDHQWGTAEGAAAYYQERLIRIKELWHQAGRGSFRLYMDAEALVANTEVVLNAFSERLELVPRLQSRYETFALTGKRGYGDSSSAIEKGHVAASGKTYEGIQVPASLLHEARDTYHDVRGALIGGADRRLLAPASEIQSRGRWNSG